MKIKLELLCTKHEWSPGQWESMWSFPGSGDSRIEEAVHRAEAKRVQAALADVGIEAEILVREVRLYFPKEW